MRTTSVRLAAVLAFATCAVLSASALTGFDTDYDAARERAKTYGRHMMLYFAGSDWCKLGNKLEEEVFAQPKFLSTTTNEFELVVLDFPKDKSKQTEAQRKCYDRLFRKFKPSFPMVAVIDACDESVMFEAGYIKGGVDKWLENMRKKMKLHALKKASLGPLGEEMGCIIGRFFKAAQALGDIDETADKEMEIRAFQKIRLDCIHDTLALVRKVKAAQVPEEIERERWHLLEFVKASLEVFVKDVNDYEFDPQLKDLAESVEGERGKGQKQEERKP